MTAIATLTAGVTGSYTGYGRAGSAFATGSISAEPFTGFTLVALLTSGLTNGDFLALDGNTVATFLDTAVSIDGRVWTIAQPGTFTSGRTEYLLTTSGAEFANGTTYSVATGALGGALHAVTTSLIHGADTSPALPAVVSGKRTFSTARGRALSANARYMLIRVSAPNASPWPNFMVFTDGYAGWTNNMMIVGASFWSDFVIGTEDSTNGNRLVQFTGEATVQNEIEVLEAWLDVGANRWRGAMNGVAAEIDVTGFNINLNGLTYCLYDSGAMDLYGAVALDRVPTTDERAELRAFITPPTVTSANSIPNAIGTTLAHSLTSDQAVTWSIVGGTDAALFEISGSTLRWLSNGVSSSNGNKLVTVRATNASGLTTDQAITVPVYTPFTGPTFGAVVAAGASSAATFNLTITAMRGVGRRMFVAVMTANQALTTPAGWNLFVPDSGTPSRGTAAAAGGVRVTVFWRDSDNTETVIAIPDSGNIQFAAGASVDRVGSTAIEFGPSIAGNVAATTAGSFTGVTTPSDNHFQLSFVASDRDSATANWAPLTYGNLENGAERFDNGTNTGTGGGIAIFTGEKQAAGATGNITATHAASAAYVFITLTVRSVSAGGSGSLVKTIPAVTSSATGKLAIKGSLARTIAAITSTGVGKLALKGSVARTIAAITSAATGQHRATGTTNRTLGPVTSTGAGYHYRLASAAITIGAVTATAAGRLAIKGSAGATIGPIVATATGRVSIRGVVAATLGPVSATSSGKLAIRGAAIRTLGAVTALSYGTSRHIGTVAAAIGPVTSSSAGKLAINAAVARSIGAVTVTAVGGVAIPGAITGALIRTLPPVTSSSSGRLAIRGSLVRTLPAITASSAGQHRAAASLTVTLGPVTSTSSGRLSIRAVVARTIGPIVSAATGKLSLRGALAATLDPITSLARGALALTGQLARTLGNITLTGRGFSGEAPEYPPEVAVSADPLGERIASAPAIKDIDRYASADGGSFAESTPALGDRYASANPLGDREA